MSSAISNATTPLRLLADVGGTNARFALQAGADGAITQVQTLPCADHASLGDAIEHYLAQRSPAERTPSRATVCR